VVVMTQARGSRAAAAREKCADATAADRPQTGRIPLANMAATRSYTSLRGAHSSGRGGFLRQPAGVRRPVPLYVTRVPR
jgi:hypothetical protein